MTARLGGLFAARDTAARASHCAAVEEWWRADPDEIRHLLALGYCRLLAEPADGPGAARAFATLAALHGDRVEMVRFAAQLLEEVHQEARHLPALRLAQVAVFCCCCRSDATGV